MPVHKIPAASLHEDLIALAHDGESVVTVTPIHDGTFFVVTTMFHGNNIETRDYETPADIVRRLGGVTHQARAGVRDPLLAAFIADGIVVDGDL